MVPVKRPWGWRVGLSNCLGVIEEYNGTLEVMNSTAGGAVFTIPLPISEC
jgi:K+-sensing histidine kinase KdpD